MTPLREFAMRCASIRRSSLIAIHGRVVWVSQDRFGIDGLSNFVCIGDCIALESRPTAFAEIIKIESEAVVAKLYANDVRISIGMLCRYEGRFSVAPSLDWLGRVINGLGEPIDLRGPLTKGPVEYARDRLPPPSYLRRPVTATLNTGIKVIDTFTPICRGQRIGVFAGSGVGKSTLLGMFGNGIAFDSIVVALVGERGREVREFIDEVLGENVDRAVTIVSTSDESAMMRRSAAQIAMSVAEALRDHGKSVLLIVDSVTRYAQALREIALAGGEAPVARGFPASVFAEMPKLLERAGAGLDNCGSITAVFSVLVDGDDHNDPIADAIRGTLDGHIVLDREIASRGQFPAVNVLGSVSRLAQHAWSDDQAALVQKARRLLAIYEETKDVRALGGYSSGQDRELDLAVALAPQVYKWLKQSPRDQRCDDPFRALADVLQFGVGSDGNSLT